MIIIIIIIIITIIIMIIITTIILSYISTAQINTLIDYVHRKPNHPPCI